MTLSDRIERTMLLPVPRERVWDAVTKPEQLARWFGVVRAMDFRVGGAIQLSWENKPCPYPGVIEAIEPVRRFAFRWPSYAVAHPEITFDIVPSTLVDITLEEHAEGTLLTLVESGFASQPLAVPAEELYRGNQDGWQECLNGLRAYLQHQEVV
ncbi:ATPase [Ktedonosporobacter rubrisoli]|uniref:ATPase n=1 Tax=Ktedonosporobacter rubrisoli TaxID=2509675 RepID=A0A4P6JZ44_KTERU|nr:SRPBCC domain-containing protein [Ktedonosporobacter rubrisoli]QBD81019.1 ATPase [Ktedonosporobacter rubrisoli]